MKKTASFLLLALTFSAFAKGSSPDDRLSEELAPLLSNYLEDYQARFEAVHVFSTAPGQSITNPVFLLPVTGLKASSLLDCDENASSLVCQTTRAIEAYIKINAVTKGKINLKITIFQNAKVVKEFKDIEVLSF